MRIEKTNLSRVDLHVWKCFDRENVDLFVLRVAQHSEHRKQAATPAPEREKATPARLARFPSVHLWYCCSWSVQLWIFNALTAIWTRFDIDKRHVVLKTAASKK